MDEKPLVSIGMPVYNGERFLSNAIESILNQTFTDFELIITDNDSDDRTEEICKAYSKMDSRILYHRNPKNLGAAENFNLTFKLARGEFFKWAAHDDTISNDYLEKCLNVLEQDPDVVLCHTLTRIITQDRQYNYLTHTRADTPVRHKRFEEMVLVEHWCFQVFGVYRSRALEQTRLVMNHSGADKNLLAEISLVGKVHEIQEYLFFRGAHAESSTTKYPDMRDLMVWYDPKNKELNRSPTRTKFHAYYSSITHIQMSWRERLLCYISLGKSSIIIMTRKIARKAKLYNKPSELAQYKELNQT